MTSPGRLTLADLTAAHQPKVDGASPPVFRKGTQVAASSEVTVSRSVTRPASEKQIAFRPSPLPKETP